MTIKTADEPRKTIETGVKTPRFRRISGQCYKSFRLNGTNFRRNSLPTLHLELPLVYAVLKCNAHKDLRPITINGRRDEFRKYFLSKTLHRMPDFSLGTGVIQGLTTRPARLRGFAKLVAHDIESSREAAMYHAVGLLQATSDFTIPEAAARLRQALPQHAVTAQGARIRVERGEWWIAVELVAGPHLRGETEGLVSKLAGLEPAEADAYVNSEKRVEVWTDVPDSFMEHFNDYLSIVGVLKSFRGLLAVDPKEPGVL